MKAVRDRLIDELYEEIQGTAYSRYEKKHIRRAVKLFESLVFLQMRRNKGVLVKNMLSIFPDPGAVAVANAKYNMMLKNRRERRRKWRQAKMQSAKTSLPV